jgi:hypothetical protein
VVFQDGKVVRKLYAGYEGGLPDGILGQVARKLGFPDETQLIMLNSGDLPEDCSIACSFKGD